MDLAKFSLHYHKDPRGNFGDDLNEWLWPRIAPDLWSDSSEIGFCGIGTLVDRTMPKRKKWVVFSSGVGYGPRPKDFGGAGWEIACVRGPLSAKILGLPKESYITDGAALLSLLPECRPLPDSERRGILFMPHHKGIDDSQLEEACALSGIEYLSPRADSKTSVQKIRHASLVLADAMHCAIVADTLRVPWVPVQTSKEINTFKWLDWTLSLDMPYEAIVLPSSSALEACRNATLGLYGHEFALSRSTMDAATKHYLRQEVMTSRPWWPARRNVGRAVYTRLIKSALNSPLARRTKTAWDEGALERTAKALNRAARSKAFLSDDLTWDNKRNMLAERFEAISKRRIAVQ